VADAKVKKFDRSAEKAWKERAEVGRLYWYLYKGIIVELIMVEPIYISSSLRSGSYRYQSMMTISTSYKQLVGLEPLDFWMLGEKI